MTETPAENVKLSFEQLQAIDTTQKRLAVLESEIAIATKVLKGTKLECDRATKEIAYKNELLDSVNLQVKTVEDNLISLNETLANTREELAKVNSEISTKSSVQTAKDMEFKDREDGIVAKELALSNKEEVLSKNIAIHESDRKDFNEKIAKLKEVIDTF